MDSDGLNQIICTYIWSKDLSFFYFYGNPKGTSVNSGKRTKKWVIITGQVTMKACETVSHNRSAGKVSLA